MNNTNSFISEKVFSYPYLDDCISYKLFYQLDEVLYKINDLLINTKELQNRYLDIIYEISTFSKNSPLYHYCQAITTPSSMRGEDLQFLLEGINFVYDLNNSVNSTASMQLNRGVLFEVYCKIFNTLEKYVHASIFLAYEHPTLSVHNIVTISACHDTINNISTLLQLNDSEIFGFYVQMDYYINLYRKVFNRLYKSYLRIVYSEAKKIVKTKYDSFPSVFQNGSRGLIKSIDYFDTSKGFSFRTYASSRIRKCIFEESEKEVNFIPIVDSVWRKYKKFKNVEHKYHKHLGDSIEHVSTTLNVEIEKIEKVYHDVESKRVCWLDAPVSNQDEGETTLLDTISQSTFEVEQEDNLIDTSVLGKGIKKKIMSLLFGFVDCSEESKIDKNILRDEIVRQLI